MKDDRLRRLIDDWQEALPQATAQTKATIAKTLAQPTRRRHWPWIIGVVLGGAAGLLLAGYVFAPVQAVLAKVPLVRWMYQGEFGGNQEATLVAKAGKLQGVNQTQTNNGVTMTLTSAYVQGRTVAVSGKIAGVDADHARNLNTPTFVYHADKIAYRVRSTAWHREGKKRYTFQIGGTLAKAPSTKTRVRLPLVFTKVMGKETKLRFSLSLRPSKKITRNVDAAVTQNGYRVQVQSLEQYDGGTGTIRLRITQTKAAAGYDYAVNKITVNGGKRDYLLGNLSTAHSGRVYDIACKVKALPKILSSVTIHADSDYVHDSYVYRLDRLPQRIAIPHTQAVYRFKPATLQDGRVQFGFSLTGTGYSDAQLQENFKYGLSLRLADDSAWASLSRKANAQGIGSNELTLNSIWPVDSQAYHFTFSTDLPKTLLANQNLATLAVEIPANVMPAKHLRPVTIPIK